MSQRPDSDQEMPLISHLTELRTRLLRIVGAVLLLTLMMRAQDVPVPSGFGSRAADIFVSGMMSIITGWAVLRRSGGLRKLAMAGVALTIAKVFLIDMSGLSGLTRVVSFIGLGLALTALAWLNRKISQIWDRGPSAPEA